MLPKPEKIKKPQKTEQLKLDDKVVKQDKLKNKRRLLVIILFLTVGLSVIFSMCNTIKSINFSLPAQIPTISVLPPSTSLSPIGIDSDIAAIIKTDTGYWSFFVQSDSFTWSKNQDQIFNQTNQSDQLQQLAQSPIDNSDLAYLTLPQGLNLKKVVFLGDGFYRVGYQIITPQKNINIIIKLSGPDITNSQKLLPKIVSSIYWKLI